MQTHCDPLTVSLLLDVYTFLSFPLFHILVNILARLISSLRQILRIETAGSRHSAHLNIRGLDVLNLISVQDQLGSQVAQALRHHHSKTQTVDSNNIIELCPICHSIAWEAPQRQCGVSQEYSVFS